MESTWFHIDMDAFFASIEQHDHPEFRGKPVVVGAKPGQRGVVSTCSYEARRYGIHSAMPISEAYRLCPHAIFLQPDMSRYHEVSAQVMKIFSDFAPEIIQVSVDEAFLNMSGTQRLLGSPESIAHQIKNAVHQATGLTISIGVATNKFLAKIASAFKKPNGLTMITAGTEQAFVLALPLEKMWGLGKITLGKLQDAGIRSVEALHQATPSTLNAVVGKASAEFLAKAAQGLDPGIYEGITGTHSISSETTFEYDTSDIGIIEQTLFELCNHAMFRLRHEKALSKVVSIKLRLQDFSTFSIQKTVGHDILSIEETYKYARELLLKKWDGRSPLRLIGFSFDKIHTNSDSQSLLFEDPDERRSRVEEAVLGIKKRYKNGAIQKASLLQGRRNKP